MDERPETTPRKGAYGRKSFEHDAEEIKKDQRKILETLIKLSSTNKIRNRKQILRKILDAYPVLKEAADDYKDELSDEPSEEEKRRMKEKKAQEEAAGGETENEKESD